MSSGKCRKCDLGQYLLIPPGDSLPKMCKSCPASSKAKCLGGTEIMAMPGYWRSSVESDNFIECRNEEACLGGVGLGKC